MAISARPTVTFPVAALNRGTKLYCLEAEAHVWKQLADKCYLKADRLGIELRVASQPSQNSHHWPLQTTPSIITNASVRKQSYRIRIIHRLVTAKRRRQMSCCQSLDASSRAQCVTNAFGGRAPSGPAGGALALPQTS